MKKFWEIILILNVMLFIIDVSMHLLGAAMFQGLMSAWAYYEVTTR